MRNLLSPPLRYLAAVPLLGLGLFACQSEGRASPAADAQRAQTSGMQPGATAELDADMQAVIDAHTALGPKPIAQLEPAQARMQPSPADAVKSVLRAQGKSTSPAPGVTTKDVTYPGWRRDRPTSAHRLLPWRRLGDRQPRRL